MSENDTLFELVKSLSAVEQKGFVKNLTVYDLKGRKNLFIVLFQALSGMESYRYEDLTKAVRNKIEPKSLSSVKSQLKGKLITYLRENTPHPFRQWHDLLEEAYILCRRGLFKEAEKFLGQVKNEAKEANRYYYVIAALYLEKLTVQHVHEKDLITATRLIGNNLIAASNAELASSRIYTFYTTIMATVFKGAPAVRNAETLNLLKQLQGDPVNDLDTASINKDQRLTFLLAKHNLSRLLCRFDGMNKYAEEFFELFKSDPAYFYKYQPHNIPAIYMSYIESAMIAKKREQWLEALTDYKAYIDKTFPGINFYSCYYAFGKSSYDIHNGAAKEKLKKTVEGLQHFYDANENTLVLSKKFLELSLLWGYYRLSDYEASLDYCRKLIQENTTEQAGEEMEDLVRIISLIIRFEALLKSGFQKKDVVTFNSLTTSEYHYFRKKRGSDYRLENAFISLFRQVAKAGEKRHLIPPLEKLRGDVEQWLEEGVLSVHTFNLGFKIVDWIDKQIEM